MALWSRLLDRGSEELAPLVHLMEGHQKSIEKFLAEIETEMGAWHSSAGSERGEALADALDRMIPLLNEHMGLEEERILPIVEKYITVTEWEEMVKEGVARIRPENVPLVLVC